MKFQSVYFVLKVSEREGMKGSLFKIIKPAPVASNPKKSSLILIYCFQTLFLKEETLKNIKHFHEDGEVRWNINRGSYLYILVFRLRKFWDGKWGSLEVVAYNRDGDRGVEFIEL